LDPHTDLISGDTCTLTVYASAISDQDTYDPPDHMAVDFSSGFTVDKAPKVVVPVSWTASGANSAQITGFTESSPQITVTFDEPVNLTTSTFSLMCPAAQTFTTNPALPTGNVTGINISPSSPLSPGTNCTLTIIANNISDSDISDPPDNMANNFDLTFTVDSAPSSTLIETEVGNTYVDITSAGASNVDQDSTIRLSFSEPVNLTFPASGLQCPAGSAINASISGNGTSVITVDPDVNLPINTLCVLDIPASNISDVDSIDPPDQPVAAISQSFQTISDFGPTVSTNPSDGASNIDASSNITVTFNEPVSLSGNWFNVTCSTSGTRISIGGLAGAGITIIENTPNMVYTIDPVTFFVPGEMCAITITSANVLDFDTLDPPNDLDGDASGDTIDGDSDNYIASFTVSP
jgi:methionine-rich copper-binding protein CopC